MAAQAGPHAPSTRVDSMASPGGHAHDHHAAASLSADSVKAVHLPPAGPSLQKLGKEIRNNGRNNGRDNGGNDGETDQRKHNGKCSACASCCLGVALPSATLSFQAIAPSGAPVAGMFHAAAVFLTDGLERPPRTLLI
jgi:hypothetical protein